jgi:serine/threonine-protein kinase
MKETIAETLDQVVAPARKVDSLYPEQIAVLWRQRLRLAALLLFAGFAVFLIRRVIQVWLGGQSGSAAESYLFWSHAAITAILGLFAILLTTGSPSSYFRLCTAEFALFGFPAVLFLTSQYFITLRACDEWGVFLLSADPWLVLIFTYALFIPSTARRATIVLGAIAAGPILMVLVMSWLHSRVAAALTFEELTGLVLILLLATVGGVIGVHRITTLRGEALLATRLGHYRLKEPIGSGGMGVVYLAEHELLKRPCVIKLIRRDKVGDEKTLARFQREVQATARLSHWNTVEILDYGRTEDGTLYYVMEYLPGMSLAEMVERHGPLAPERGIYLLLQVCDALREAHQSGLVHRDIKPANIFVSQRGGVYDVVKLLDFGLVKPIAEDQPVHLTAEGMAAGTPLFMSPEQAVGDASTDARSDIYSLGASAYYLLTGQPPFRGENVVKLVIAHANEAPLPPSRHNGDIPNDLERIILKCLAKDRSERFQNITELESALAQCASAGRWSREKAAEWWLSRAPSI